MILSDKQITKLANEDQMIAPFVNKSISKGISHGLNSFGYDLDVVQNLKYLLILKEQQRIRKILARTIL